MIRVMYATIDGPGGFLEREFMDDCVLKVLRSGVLKIIQPPVIEIPAMGEEDSDNIVKEPEIVLAVFNGEYIMERTQ